MDKKVLLLIGKYPCRKSELARLYSPNVCLKSALRLLNAYMLPDPYAKIELLNSSKSSLILAP